MGRRKIDNAELRKISKLWYKKLRDDGFNDIEGGVEGHLMQGGTPTSGLKALMPLLKTNAFGEPDGWLDEQVADYFDKGKTAYYQAADLVATLGFRSTLPADQKFAWSMHADGIGEPVISEELGIKRHVVRKYLVGLRERMRKVLDRPYE